MRDIAIAIAIVAIATLSACSASAMTEEFCHRADSCNLLSTSVNECIEDLDTALEELPPSQRDEIEHVVQQCLDRPSCSGFASCISSLRTTDGVEAGLRASGDLLESE